MEKKNVDKRILDLKNESRHRLFVLCSDKFKDDPVYACVQGGHAVAKYMYENMISLCEMIAEGVDTTYFDYWNNETIVYVWYSHDKMNGSNWTLYNNGLKYIPKSEWCEPDQNNEITAQCIWEDDVYNPDNYDYHDEDWGIEYAMKILNKLELVK